MRKKLFTFLLAMVASVGPIFAESGTCGDNLTWDLTNGVLTISGTGAMTDYDSNNSVPWTDAKGMISSVIISEGVTSIGKSAFSGCTNLASVVFPNTLANIGDYAFGNCDSLRSVFIPNAVNNIGQGAFYLCDSLESINVGADNQYYCSVNGVLFNKNMTALIHYPSGKIDTSYNIPNSVTEIGKYAFYICKKLTSVTIPNSVSYIGERGFYSCSGLTSITIPSSVDSIGYQAFYQCKGLTSVHIDDLSAWCKIKFNNIRSNPTCYAHKLYLNGELIKDLVLPDDIEKIQENAFDGCDSLTSVVIPANITSIGECAFYECPNIMNIFNYSEIPQTIKYNVFNHVDKSSCTLHIPAQSAGLYNSATGWKLFVKIAYLPCDDVVASGDCGDNGNNVTWKLFCDGRLKISGTGAMTNYTSFSSTPWFSNRNSIQSVAMEEGVTTIGNNAFAFCNNLTSVTIPNSVTNIGNDAFMGCSGLSSITIPNIVTGIGDGAFSYCSALTAIEIPDAVTEVGLGAFYECTNLSSVIIGENLTTVGDLIFTGCSNLHSIQWNAIHCNDFTSNSTPFYYNYPNSDINYDIRSQITSFTFGDEVEYIPAYLCYGMTNISNLIIPNCYIEIGTNALYQCNYQQGVTYSIVLPDTTLCYGEELIIDGVQCNIQKTPNIRQMWTRTLTTTKGCDSIISISVLWERIAPLSSFNFTTKDVTDTPNSGSISWTVSGNTDYKYDYYTLNGQKKASLSNLSEGNYRLVFYSEECGDSIVKNITINQYGMKVGGMYYLLDENNNTAILTYRGTSYDDYSGEYSGNITIPKTITFEGIEYQVTGINSSTFSGCSNISIITMESETPISMYNSGLSNNCIIYVPYGSVNAYKSASGWRNYTIHVINPSHVTSTTGATSATITLGNTDEAKHIISCGMEGGEEEFAGNVIEYIGLEPNSEYANIPLFIKTKEGDLDNTTVSFITTALELTTKPSKPVSSTTALLFAETNMSDAEVSCGFEYKRNDAPADMDGTKVFCPVASGQMAGRLKNLKDDVYYKYRAFYQSAAGNMYYGDWQYIFTGDVAVEFDPILYTYGATVVKENEATISGYALAGSEDFTEQGFEYWAESRANNGANAPRRMHAALNEHFFVQASGISLRVTLTNLDAGTVYKYRVYGKVGDQYYYGSEQTFTTTGTYTPPTYTITFANWDGAVLQSSQVEEGTLPEYTGATPIRPDDEQYTYVFNGWTPAIVVATTNATYTATYQSEPKSQGIEDVQGDDVQCTKVLINGQIFILRGDKIYTTDGRLVR